MKLNINNKKALLASSLILTETITYCSFSKCLGKPFTKNELPTYKITSTEYSKDGVIEKEYYNDKVILKSAITLKTPYYKNIDGTFGRDIYDISVSSYSDEEIAYILNNVDNQEELLNQDYIKELVKKAKNPSNEFKFVRRENIDNIPSDNDYEISYTVYDEDLNDVKMYSSKLNDTILTLLYSLISGGEIIVCISYFKMLEEARKEDSKQKIKTL